MDLNRKFTKLIDPDIVASTRQHLARLFHPISAPKLLATLEKNVGWEELRRKYPRREKEVHRFGDTNFWVKRNVERAQDLALDRPPNRYLLDLGCGAGYFLWLARQLGHDGVGLDIDEQPIFRDALELLGVPRIVHRIEPGVPLPAPARKFDLITSFLTCFHRLERQADGDWATWSPAQWQYFLEDIREHQLAPGGTLVLEFHPQRNGQLYPAEVGDLFGRHGARFVRSRVFFRAKKTGAA